MGRSWRKIFINTILPAMAGILAMWAVLFFGGAPKNIALIDAGISVFLFAIGATVLGNILRYYRPSERREWHLGAWLGAINTAWLFGSYSLITLVIPDNDPYNHNLQQSLLLRFCVAGVVLTCVALVTWIRRQSESEAKSMARYNEIEKISRETELNALRQQLQPHFLFNSLNSIQALTTVDSQRAKKMVIQLSDFLRGTLRKDNHTQVSMAEEIEHTRLYLEIEMVRFSDRLQVEWELGENIDSKKVPALILQPLVENAIKFGVYQTSGPVKIHIGVKYENDMLQIMVQNPYDKDLVDTTRGTGFGLTSLQRRLYLLYSRKDMVKTEKDGEFFRAYLQIPIVT